MKLIQLRSIPTRIKTTLLFWFNHFDDKFCLDAFSGLNTISFNIKRAFNLYAVENNQRVLSAIESSKRYKFNNYLSTPIKLFEAFNCFDIIILDPPFIFEGINFNSMRSLLRCLSTSGYTFSKNSKGSKFSPLKYFELKTNKHLRFCFFHFTIAKRFSNH